MHAHHDPKRLITILATAVLVIALALAWSSVVLVPVTGPTSRPAEAGLLARSFMPVAGPYPGPTYAPTRTPVPAGQYYPIPDGLQYTIVSLDTSLDADVLVGLQGELSGGDAVSLSGRTANPLKIAIGGEECKNGVSPAELEAVLTGLFGAGSIPLIQGYYRQELYGGSTRILSIVIAGWQGSIPVPSYTPTPMTPWCDLWPTRPSVWTASVSDDETDWHWSEWESGPYEAIVQRYSGSGIYYVIRP